MRVIALAVFAFVLAATLPLGSPAIAADDATAAMAALTSGLDAFDKGNEKGFLDLCLPQMVIIDEFPPHSWTSCSAWAKAYAAYSKAHGDTDPIVKVTGKPMHVDINGSYAYVVVPTSYTFKEHGKPMSETGASMTMILKKTAAGYRYAGWSWAEGKL
jgi:hypothetical protein